MAGTELASRAETDGGAESLDRATVFAVLHELTFEGADGALANDVAPVDRGAGRDEQPRPDATTPGL